MTAVETAVSPTKAKVRRTKPLIVMIATPVFAFEGKS